MTKTTNASLGYRFGMLSRLNALFVNEQLKPFGLSTGQVACFAALLHSDVPLTQDEISTSLAIDPAATARTVELLIKKKAGAADRESGQSQAEAGFSNNDRAGHGKRLFQGFEKGRRNL